MWRLFAYGGAALWGAGVPLLFYGALRRHRDYVNPPLDASTRERLAAQEWIACYSTFGQARESTVPERERATFRGEITFRIEREHAFSFSFPLRTVSPLF